MQNKRTHLSVFILACMIAIAILPGSAAHATALFPFPWKNENSVRAALTQQEGQTVVCEATVARIAARNNPPYFVLKDEFRASTDSESRIVVLCRPPLNLGSAARVQGVLGRLPNNEPCILNPTVEGFFDQQGRPLCWTPFPEFMTAANTRVLPIPSDPVPPSDPSLVSADDGMGIPGEVSAYSTQGVSRFDTVASLLATDPPILSLIALSAKPVVNVGDGFIVVGDDTTDAAVKVYTNATVKLTDRLLMLTAVAHSEGGRLVLYAGAGPAPFYDEQGPGGGVSVAKVGTVAYAATLRDSSAAGEQSHSFSVMSVSPPTSSDGSWVYLTGQVVSYSGKYWSYELYPSTIGNWVYVYDIQGLDRTPGMRVWTANNSSIYAGNIVDVMAKLDTKDGQRLLGIVDTTYPYDYSSVECNVLNNSSNNNLPVPVGMNNRALGGVTVGNNPGVTNGYGLYNIGNYVTIWGKVLEVGNYPLNNSSNYSYFIRIDDGSGVNSGSFDGSGNPKPGVLVFGTKYYINSVSVNVGDYVSASGVSSIWQPNGSMDTYRCIWTSNYACNQTDTPATRQIVNTGTICGTVKLYDMPNEQATVQMFCTSGHFTTLIITRGADGSGSATYSFSDIPRTVSVGGANTYPTYVVSAKCDGFKTRTYPSISPGSTATVRNIYVVPLRKIYATASTFNLYACAPNQPSTITATVRDSDHNLVPENVKHSETAPVFN